MKHNKLSDCRVNNCAVCNRIHHVLVGLEPAGEHIFHKATDDDNAGEEAYGPDEDIYNNEDRQFNWGNHQSSESES